MSLLAVNAGREILFVKEIKPFRDTEPNWELPGGFVDLLPGTRASGESLEIALQREIEEELGQENSDILLRTMSYLTSCGETYVDGTPVVATYFVAEVQKADLKPTPNPNVKTAWFEMNELPSFEYPADREAIAYFRGLHG